MFKHTIGYMWTICHFICIWILSRDPVDFELNALKSPEFEDFHRIMNVAMAALPFFCIYRMCVIFV